MKRQNQDDEEDDGIDPNTIINREEHFQGSMRKYWYQRYDIFAKYDNGILLTKELWFSVTPESISKFTAKFINYAFNVKDKNTGNRELVVMDAFCGGGGNVIQFLEYSDKIYAIDINSLHLHCTFNNCTVYCERDYLKEHLELLPLDWTYVDTPLDDEDDSYSPLAEDEIYADKKKSLETLKKLKEVRFDCIFGSPPWGGPAYIKEKIYDVNNLIPFDLEKLLKVFLEFTDHIVLFLPKNLDLNQLKEITERVFGDESIVRVLRMSSHGRAKGLLCCWGEEFVNVDLKDLL